MRGYNICLSTLTPLPPELSSHILEVRPELVRKQFLIPLKRYRIRGITRREVDDF